MKAINIVWDTDGEEVDLPEEVSIPLDILNMEDITEYLSDKYGWCINSLEIIDMKELIQKAINEHIEELKDMEQYEDMDIMDYDSDEEEFNIGFEQGYRRALEILLSDIK